MKIKVEVEVNDRGDCDYCRYGVGPFCQLFRKGIYYDNGGAIVECLAAREQARKGET